MMKEIIEELKSSSLEEKIILVIVFIYITVTPLVLCIGIVEILDRLNCFWICFILGWCVVFKYIFKQ